jgi:hypothetical protein
VLLASAVIAVVVLVNQGEHSNEPAAEGPRPVRTKQEQVARVVAPVTEPPVSGLLAQKHVTRLMYSPDGKRLAAAVWNPAVKGGDPALQVWDSATNKPVASFPGHASPVSQLAFSPDGMLLASSCPGEIKLWDCRNGTLVHELRDEQGSPRLGERLLAFSPDAKVVLSVAQGWVVWMDVASGEVGRQVIFINWTAHVAASPVAPVLAIAQLHDVGKGALPALTLYDYMKREEQILTLSNTGTGLAFSADGKTLAMATGNGAVEIMDMQTQKPRAILPKLTSREFLYYERLELNQQKNRKKLSLGQVGGRDQRGDAVGPLRLQIDPVADGGANNAEGGEVEERRSNAKREGGHGPARVVANQLH